MIEGKTKSGFKYEFDETNLDDWEYLETLSEIDEGNIWKTPKMIKTMLGEKQYKALKDFLRKDGKVTIEAMTDEFNEIMQSASDLKN